jgi:hypothetical protein
MFATVFYILRNLPRKLFKNSSTLKCNLCNNFIGTNLKSIAAHKRKCKGNKTIDEISSDDISTESLPNDISTDILTDMSMDVSADISADSLPNDISADMPKEKKK